MNKTLVEKVKTAIRSHDLLHCGDSVLVAISGGADSVCLLDVLTSLKEELSLTLFAAHLNHMLRGDESERDEKFVRNLCAHYKVSLFCKKVDISALSDEKKCSLEEAGRIARYDFFRDLQKEHGIIKIATAHNKDDNVETVLMRFFRGTGLKGLCGIPVQNDSFIIRPLLHVKRAEIESYLAEKKLNFVTDSSNFKDDYTRNKIRNQFIPYIKTNLNPNLIDTLGDNIINYGETESFLENCTKKVFDKIVRKENFGFSIQVAALLKEDPCLAKRTIAKVIHNLNSETNNQSVSAIYQMVKCEKKKSVCINQDLSVYFAYDTIFFVKKKVCSPFSFPFCNHDDILEKGHSFSFEKGTGTFHHGDKNTIYIRGDIAPKDLFIRSRLPGDKIYLENCGHKKVKDLLIDEKIPVFLRENIPVLLFENEIIWVCGIRDNPLFRAKQGDTYLKITYQKEKNHA